jgi:tetratricopeptide (TPR) repeat protein
MGTVAAQPPLGAPLGRMPREADVGALIEQLGHPRYAMRVRARESLERMGLQAFDDLHEAQYHPDSEIAMTSRYLVGSLMVSWSTDTDPPAVREALDEYGAQSDAERQNRMDRLAELPGRQGLAALARLVRFETSLRLSREAALAIMRGAMSEDAAVRRAEASTIRDVLGPNTRQAADWLRVYADDLEKGEYSADAWSRLIAQQRLAVDEGNDSAATRPAVLELVRVCATRAARAGQIDQALAVASEHLDLIPPRSDGLIDACSWAIDNKLHPLVLKLRARHPAPFARHPILLYNAAEATLAGDMGNTNAPTDAATKQADELAIAAAAIDPLPMHGTEAAETMSPKAVEEIAQRHRETGRSLQSRGLFRWAEREYRHIIDSLPIDAILAANARADLAVMFGELNRHQEVVDALEPIVDRTDKDQAYARRLQAQALSVARLKSTMMYHKGLAAAARKADQDAATARETLLTALELEPDNVDILIAMYRTEGDEDWQKLVRRRIQSVALMFDNQIEASKLQSQARIRFPDLEARLADSYNQYAWLICNTEGDQKKALQYSLKSLELAPDNPAQLDTCGRCYFALGDYENAVRVQRRAVKLEPHSPPLLRQLEEFEAALAAKNAEPASAESNPAESQR